MKNEFKKNKGYAILVTIVIISIILVIITGLSRSVYKQLLLTSSAKDSQIAFYQADTASECALYFDRVKTIPVIPTTGDNEDLSQGEDNLVNGSVYNCGGQNSIFSGFDENGSYTLNPEDENSIDRCFRIKVVKSKDENNYLSTQLIVDGYNICNMGNLRTVDRTIEINY